MPKFIYTIMLISIGLWVLWSSRIFMSDPTESKFNIAIFLILLFFAISFTISIPTFFINRKKSSFEDKKIYRKSLKWGFFSSFGIIGLFALKGFDVLNIYTIITFIAMYFGFYFFMKTQK